MKNREISRAYAIALNESLKAEEKEVIASQLSQLSKVFLDADVGDFLENPLVSNVIKGEVFSSAISSLQGSQIFKNFLSIVSEKNRLMFIPEISEVFEELLNESSGVVKGKVYSVAELGDEDKNRLTESIEKVVNKKVKLSYQQDASLLGGLVAKVGDWHFDDSLKSHLKNLNDELKLNRSAN